MLLKVTGKRNRQRLIPFAERLKEMIIYYINVRAREVGEDGVAFFVRKDGRPVTSAIVYYAVKKQLSSLPTLAKRSPHVLRHTFATSMLNDGATISAVRDLLGHSSLASTSIYTHVTFEELKKVYNAHPRAKIKED
jgi:integrase/recombinase XerC